MSINYQRFIVYFFNQHKNHHIGCSLSLCGIVAGVARRRLSNILVSEDDATFLNDTLYHLSCSVHELERQYRHLFCVEAYRWGRALPLADGYTALEIAQDVTCTLTLAHNASVFPRILAEVPKSTKAMIAWIDRHRGFDQY